VLAAGEPGGGKSALLQIIAAYAAMSARSRLVLFDGKLVELGLYKSVADEFVGPDIDHAIITLRRLQRVMDNRYAWLEACGRRKIEPRDGITTVTAIFDEIALYSTVLGTEQQQKEFVTLLRDLVARGRAAGIIVIAATQRPSVDIIPKSQRHHPRRRLVRPGLYRRRHPAHQPRRRPAHRRGRHPAADQDRLPHR
jgi:S-DNA-T family DNA segregation ATPase FtsK/SpoIIIE